MFGPNNRVGSKCCNNYLRKAILIVVVIPFFNHFWLFKISSHGNARNLLRIFLGYISLDYLSQADRFCLPWNKWCLFCKWNNPKYRSVVVLSRNKWRNHQQIPSMKCFFKCFTETSFQMSGMIKTLSDSISQWKSDTSQINCYCNWESGINSIVSVVSTWSDLFSGFFLFFFYKEYSI